MKLLKMMILFGLCCSSAWCAPKRPSSKVLSTTMHQRASEGDGRGCNVSICFAIDGSGSITKTEFESAKHFAQDVVLGSSQFGGFEYGAVQYGAISTTISPVVEDESAFAVSVESATRRNSGATSIAAGIAACDFQLTKRGSTGSKIILISDGRNNFGEDPVLVANNFRLASPRREIMAVAIGKHYDLKMLQAIANGRKPAKIDDLFEVILLNQDFLQSSCGVPIIS